MKKIGLIENMGYDPNFFSSGFESASAADVMAAVGGNTGNAAFVYGIRKLMGDHIVRIDWGTPVEFVNKEVDHVLICCANQLGSHVDLGGWADRITSFDKNVSLVGLGAQNDVTSSFPILPEGTLRFLSVVKERRSSKSTNISVRGEYTSRFLESIGFCSAPTGCPSLHISGSKELGQEILSWQNEKCLSRISVCAGNPWHSGSASLESVMIDIIDQWGGDYIIQHPVGMLQYAFSEVGISEKTQSAFMKVYGSRFANHQSLMEWFRRNASVYVDVPNWVRSIRRVDLVLGPRYHGVALAIQSGRPGMVITIDARTEELCEGTGIKAMTCSQAQELDKDGLVQAARWFEEDAATLNTARLTKAGMFSEFFNANGLTPSQHATQLNGWL